MATPTTFTYTTHTPSLLELRLAVENTRRQYAQSCADAAAAWRMYEDAIDDGDREAIRDLARLADLCEALKADAYQDREAAYAAYFGKLN